jgi:superfamily II DNA or RNA helicase
MTSRSRPGVPVTRNSRGGVEPGSIVTVRDEQWQVARVDAFDGCAVVSLVAGGCRRLRIIEPFDRILAVDGGRIGRCDRRTVMRAALKTIASARPPLGLWTAAAATIDLLPYQLEPALAVLRGSTRLLLADAVGLGKTIQAGLILSELRERGWVDRALVVCPAGLRATWADELRRRFGIASKVLDQSAIADTVATLPLGSNPWTTHATAIASIDYVKRPEVLAAIREVPIDLVIADEAHHLTPGTDRGAAICRLASRSPWCVLVSATPHSGDDAAFDYLTGIGSQRDSITIFRRSRRDARPAAGRRERIVRMHPTAIELELLRSVEHYAQAVWRGNNPSAQLVAITIARRAASSTLALERTLRRRLMLLNQPPEPAQAVLPWDEEDSADDAGAAALLTVPGLASEIAERAALDHLLLLIGQCNSTAKLRWLAASIARFHEPAIVFTEYRDTLEAILAVLPHHLRAVSICGATPVGERRHAVDAFNRGGADVLVATDTAGEGLNLHHCCRLVIDVELPWNPLRLEQRIGRIDRLGQCRRVHALRLFYPGTVEERVLERLELRRRRSDWLDDAEPIDERTVAASVLGDRIAQRTPSPLVAGATVDATAEHARLLQQRAAAALALPLHGSLAAVPRHPTGSTMVALHTVAYLNDVGLMIAHQPVAHVVRVSRRPGQRRYAIVDAIRTSDALRASVRKQAEATCSAIEDDLTPLRRAIATRIAGIRSQVASERACEVQRSLFDRRADVAAARVDETANTLDSALVRRRLSVDSRVRPEAVRERLAAVWPAGQR